MAEICEASKVSSCEPSGVRGAEALRFRFVPAVSDDSGRKRQRFDSPAAAPPAIRGGGEVESRAEHGEETGKGTRSLKSATLDSGPPREGVVVASGLADGCPRYGTMSVCGRRREMEDAVSVRPDFVRRGHRHHFFGIYDGHGCSHVAESCGDRMHEVVAEEISTCEAGLEWHWGAVMERSFARMDAAAAAECSGGGALPARRCRCELQTPKCDHVGSTAVVAVVGPGRIVVANCGDSRAVLCRDGVPVHLSSDHKPDRPDELRRIEDAGGRVIYWDGARVLGVLAMSRAIGDSYLKPYVTAEPEVTVTERSEGDECLILASDGLWDVVSNQMACDIARTCLRNGAAATAGGRGGGGKDLGEGRGEMEGEGGGDGSDKACSDAAVLLTKLALARHSTDNVSVVVIDLRRRD